MTNKHGPIPDLAFVRALRVLASALVNLWFLGQGTSFVTTILRLSDLGLRPSMLFHGMPHLSG